MIRQLQITVPAAGVTAEVNVQGRYIYVISAPEVDAGNEAILYLENAAESSGLPLLTRTAVKYGRRFHRLIIEGTADTAGQAVYLLVATGQEASADLTLIDFGFPLSDPGDLFEYNTTPGNLLVRVASAAGLVRASTLNGSGATLSTQQYRTATFLEAADPTNIYYSQGRSIVRVTEAGSNTTVVGHFLESPSEVVSGGDIRRILFAPDGSALFALCLLSTSSGSRIAVRRKDAPFNPTWQASETATIMFVGNSVTPQGTQGNGGMTIDYVRRMLYVAYTQANGANAITKLAWDGSITEIIKSYTNGITAPQPLLGGLAYCPLDDYVYYTLKTGTGPYSLHLAKLRPDGTDDQVIAQFSEDTNSLPNSCPLEYHHGADFFLTVTGDSGGDTRDVIAIDRSGNIIGNLGGYSGAEIYDLQLY